MKSPVLLGIASALVLTAFFIIIFGGSSVVVRTSAVAVAPAGGIEIATTSSSAPLVNTENVRGAPVASSTSSASATPAPKATAASAGAVPVSAPSAPTAPVAPLVQKSALDSAASRLAGAIINILCSPRLSSSSLPTISGSGVIIDPRGIIITDAHIGQFFLLENQAREYAYDCVVRTGSPAKSAYHAEPIYVSSAWVAANSAVITEDAPTGTGENDIALLGIDGSVSGENLPSTFPYVPLVRGISAPGDQIIIGSYAAQFLDAQTISNDLTQTIVYSTIKDVYTFGGNTVDLLSLGGSIAAQEGSSGGGVVDASGELAGLITTSTISGDLTKRDLHALTTDYVERSVLADTGNSFNATITGTVPNLIEGFRHTATALALEIIQQVQRK